MDNPVGSTPNPRPNAPGTPGAPSASKAGQPPQQSAPAQPPKQPPAQQSAPAPGAAQQGDRSAGQIASATKHDLQSQATSAVAAGKNRAVEGLGSVAQTLRKSAAQMRDEQQNGLAHYADQAGQQVQRVADYLRNNDAGQIADAAEDFARRQPAVFLGGTFVLGLLGARFLKSSRRKEQQEQQEQRQQQLRAQRNQQYRGSSPTWSGLDDMPTSDRERSVARGGATGAVDTLGAGALDAGMPGGRSSSTHLGGVDATGSEMYPGRANRP